MKRRLFKHVLFCAAAAAACSGGAALAADLPVKAPAVPAPPPFSWQGLYVGVNAGYGWGTSNSLDDTFVGNPVASISPRGGFGGVQAGYNSMLTPHWLLGTEFDFDWGDISGSTLSARTGFPPNPTSFSVRYFGTIRERFGFVMDRSLIYATGGVAWAQGNWSEIFPISGLSGAIGDDHVGWTAGVGYEYAFAPRWSAKVEYRYANLGRWQVTENFAGGGLRTVDLKLNTVQFGVNYRLDDGAPTLSAMPVKAYAAAPLSWGGSYVGAQAGYGWGSYNVIQGVATPPDFFGLRPKGFLGGFEAGYNWLVTPAWLVGVESDYSFGSLNDRGVTAVFGSPTNVQINDFATVRGRVGYVMGRSLLYATGGFAYIREKAFDGSGAPTTTKFYDLGWTAGAGFEYMFAPRWSAKIEYLYARFDSTLSQSGGFPLATKPDLSVVRAGVNYKFDWASLLGR